MSLSSKVAEYTGKNGGINDKLNDNYYRHYKAFRFREILKKIIYLDDEAYYIGFSCLDKSRGREDYIHVHDIADTAKYDKVCCIFLEKDENFFGNYNIKYQTHVLDHMFIRVICNNNMYGDYSFDNVDYDFDCEGYISIDIDYGAYIDASASELLKIMNSIIGSIKNNYDKDLAKLICNVKNLKFVTARALNKSKDVCLEGYNACLDGQIEEAQRLAKFIEDENLSFKVDEKLELKLTKHKVLKPYDYIFLDAEKLVNDRVFTIEF